MNCLVCVPSAGFGLCFVTCLIFAQLLSIVGSPVCDVVKHPYGNKGFDIDHVPIAKVNRFRSENCENGSSCCTPEMEKNLAEASEREYHDLLDAKISLVRVTFITSSSHFEQYINILIDHSQVELDNLFTQTYRKYYVSNKNIFNNLFQNFKAYYKGWKLNLEDAIDQFFTSLGQRIFVLMNANYVIDEAYLDCVAEDIDNPDPFKGESMKLLKSIKRSFVASRTYLQGLQIGGTIVKEVADMQPDQRCLKSLIKMQSCQLCYGMPAMKPCNNYCLNILKGCMAQTYEINQSWNSFLQQMILMHQRLIGPFNVQDVVKSVGVKISESIMNFQENFEPFRTKIFAKCGKPKYKSINPPPGDKYSSGLPDGPSKSTESPASSLADFLKDMKPKLEAAENFWSNLPASLCATLSKQSNSNCWNGHSQFGYNVSIIKDGLHNQKNNPEVSLELLQASYHTSQINLQLQSIINSLKVAYKGNDVEWIDTDDDGGSGDDSSGSGSGDDFSEGNKIIGTVFPPSTNTRWPGNVNSNDYNGLYDWGGNSSTTITSLHFLIYFIMFLLSMAF